MENEEILKYFDRWSGKIRELKKNKICDFANANRYCRMFDFCDSIIQRYN